MKTHKSLVSIAVLSTLLVGCGGGSVGTAVSNGGSTVAAVADTVEPMTKSFAYATPMASADYQQTRALTGTGKGNTVSPADIRTHYGFATMPPAGAHALDGTGYTIAIVDAPGSVAPANIIADLNTFSTYYNLPLQTSTNTFFKQIDLSNGAKVTANSTSDWKMEVALDVEWAHAIAPGAHIILVTAKSTLASDLVAAVTTAAAQPGVTVISMSFGATEFAAETSATYDGALQTIAKKGIVLVAASGDSGNNGSNQAWPAVSPYVTAVGGTAITNIAYNLPSVTTEVAWQGSGGGASKYETAQTFQTTNVGSKDLALNLAPKQRMVPDVSYNADPVKSPYGIVAGNGWFIVGGTSAGAPQWAAIITELAQMRSTEAGKINFSSLTTSTVGFFNGVIYPSNISGALFDVTGGTDNTATASCAICNATAGYDAVTGLGVPRMNILVNVM